ncbi:MAG: MobF family relaxase [Acidobacteriota bacterium]
MLTIRAMSNGRGYAAHHLEHNDYYAEGQRVVGAWQGRGAGELGLKGEVTERQFEAIRQGVHPATGDQLRPRHSADRWSEDGEIQSRGRHLYDFTFSAPKSVSVVAALGEDDRLVRAHQQAVETTLHELETSAAARVRMGGANEDRVTGNLVLAVYHHDTSRELDPQLHTHAVAGNLTYDGTEGRWKALQASDIYAQRAYLTEVYRNALAHQVRALGYDIDHRHDTRGRDVGFEIRGVSQDLLRTYSQRSQQRDQAIEAFTEKAGRRPTDNEVAVLVRDSRPDKLTEISSAEVTQRQIDRLTFEERQSLNALRQQALEAAPERERLAFEPAAPALRYAEQHLFERRSVVQDHEVLAEALRQGRGRIALEDAKGVLRLEESSGTILRDGHQIATRDSLDREREMVAAVNRGLGAFDRLGGDRAFVVSDRLRPEQQHAVHQVLASRDWAVSLRGAAGTGKTATLQELHRGLVASRRDVLAVAPTTSAVNELKRVGFSDAMTIQRLLVDPQEQANLRDRVLIVDEAGMVSARQMTALLELAGRQGARVLFSGDTRQLQSVEAGDALRTLERESGMASLSLTQVQRQTSAAYRQAVEVFREHPTRGFAQLEQMGSVREVAWADRSRSVAEAYRDAHTHLNAHGEARSVLVVCATHDDIANVTAAIRSERQQAGELGDGVLVDRYVPLHYTPAQKADPGQFHAGQVLVFHDKTSGVHPHEALEIVRAEPHQLLARTEAGKGHVVTAPQAQAFEVYERRSIEIAPHDRLLLTANRQDAGFHAVNGEIVSVSQVDDRGRIHLEDGRTIPSSFKHFDHGYAVTAHRSQGQSVDTVVIAGESMNRELFYVAASRGREQLTVITSDKARLQESVGRSGARLSASELVRTMHSRSAPGLTPDASRGFERGIRTVVEEARQSVIFEQDSHRYSVPAPVQQQAIPHAAGHEPGGAADQLERGQSHGISR